MLITASQLSAVALGEDYTVVVFDVAVGAISIQFGLIIGRLISCLDEGESRSDFHPDPKGNVYFDPEWQPRVGSFRPSSFLNLSIRSLMANSLPHRRLFLYRQRTSVTLLFYSYVQDKQRGK